MWQSIQLSLCPPRVFDFGQQVHKWTERRHGNRSATVRVASQRVRRRRVVGTTNLRSQGGSHRCVAFRTHPAHSAKEESVEQPWWFGIKQTLWNQRRSKRCCTQRRQCQPVGTGAIDHRPERTTWRHDRSGTNSSPPCSNTPSSAKSGADNRYRSRRSDGHGMAERRQDRARRTALLSCRAEPIL